MLSPTACALHLPCPKAQSKLNLSFNACTYITVLFVLRGDINPQVTGNLYTLHMLP